MAAFGGTLLIVWVVLWVALVCFPLVAFLAYRQFVGIQRALWAIRSELERGRTAAPRDVPGPRAVGDSPGGAGPSRVTSSMFGR